MTESDEFSDTLSGLWKKDTNANDNPDFYCRRADVHGLR
jgi:hypothetical protein